MDNSLEPDAAFRQLELSRHAADVIQRRVPDGAKQIRDRRSVDCRAAAQHVQEYLVQHVLCRRRIPEQRGRVRQQGPAMLVVPPVCLGMIHSADSAL